MPRDDKHPEFFRLFYDEARPIVETLPQGQAQNLLGAMCLYFLLRREPYKLPKQAMAMFEVHRARLDKYRRSVLNGMRNRARSARNPREIEAESDDESETENEADFESSQAIYLR